MRRCSIGPTEAATWCAPARSRGAWRGARLVGGRGVRVAGCAAVFDRPDRGGDVVRAGAFARSLKRGAQAVPLLWQHDAARPIGRIEYLKEDGRGVRGER